MLTLHHKYWPNIPKSLMVPQTSLYVNLRVSASRYPEHTAIYYYGSKISYQQLDAEVTALAGYLQQKLGVASGEKVLLFAQNSPNLSSATTPLSGQMPLLSQSIQC